MFVQRKEEKQMSYNKPELVVLGSAHAVIQGSMGKPDNHLDSACSFSVATAYEADE
jgi:hypothetical protein